MVGCRIIIKNRSTSDWLSTLLHREFFSSCFVHKYLRKNEQNLFCIDCKLGLCRHCLNVHSLHRRLQICKYVYQDVVRLQEMQKYLDCSKIQTYKINGEKAVHLNPRPQSKDTKPSTKSKNGGTCEACRRYLQDPPNRFCSIACKVSVEPALKPEDTISRSSFITIPIEEFTDLSLKESGDSINSTDDKESTSSLAESSDDVQLLVSSALKPRRRLHKRKGLPCRAPLL
ncbi:uncharacterized protein LOC116193562 [Punica granatum]|uniref:Uncharacterized protein LOC116193562 n=2 Tax=Punica granatum TaxID=22663 RepID=A0A6P8C3S4_PUNGR|nr:uncharacterized protein LOC116193562 [Punica granatum]PKI71252.1 hypothetical protein CRG98_008352 [Punica granatum]